MLLSALSVLVVAQSSSEIPEGLMNNPVYVCVCLCVYIRGIRVFSIVEHTKNINKLVAGMNFKLMNYLIMDSYLL